MNAKISVFRVSVKAIIYLLLYNFHDCTFNDFRFAYANLTFFTEKLEFSLKFTIASVFAKKEN